MGGRGGSGGEEGLHKLCGHVPHRRFENLNSNQGETLFFFWHPK